MWIRRGNQSTLADWFTRSDILRRIKDSSRIIAGRYHVKIGQSPADILQESGIVGGGAEGYCSHQKRMIWVNPLAVYTASCFGLRTPNMTPLQERGVSMAILRGVLGIEPNFEILRKILGENVIPRGYNGNSTHYLNDTQKRVREWMRRYNGLTIHEEWLFTQYVTFHERLHEKFTEAKEKKEQNLVGMLWNTLEDERIERLGSQRWLRVGWFVKKGNKIFWRVLRSRLYEVVRGDEPVLAIGNFTLLTRFGFRDGEIASYEIAKREVRPEFHEALDECWPHILRAWNECRNASEVKAEAEAIVEILRKHFPEETQKMMGEGTMDCPLGDLSQSGGGQPGDEEGDETQASGGGSGDDDDEGGDDLKNASPGLGDQEKDPGTEGVEDKASAPEPMKAGSIPGMDQTGAIIPSDYHEILNEPEIKEGVNRLRKAFAIPDPKEQRTKVRDRRRGRLSAKAYRKTDGEQPFITRVHQKDPGKMHVELIGDWSGSMENAAGSQESPVQFMRRAGLMVNAALQGHKRVWFNFRLMPHDIHVATNHEGEEGLMRCAGVQASTGTAYAGTFESAYQACKKADCPSLIMVIADGQFSSTGDKERTKQIREKCERDGIEVKVLYVTSREQVTSLKYAFGEESVILVPKAKDLPGHIEAMVSSMGTRQYRRVYV